MIKFACPGCQTSFNVADDKAGKKGKCPKCGSAFTIPAAGSPAPAPAPTKTKIDPNEPVEIEPCPGCGAVLTVAPEFLGADVECPSCNTVFAAAKPGGLKPKSKPAPAAEDNAFSGIDDEEDEPRPSKKGKRPVEEDDDEDDRPKKKSSKSLAKKEDDDDDYDDEDDDRPKKKKKGKKSNVECKKTMAGLLALLAGGFGVHKFYLGYTVPGIIMLLTCGGCGIVAPIEGILYLLAKDEDFIRNQQAGRKPWF